MNGKKVRRMDESIAFVMRLAYSMQFNYLVRKEKGYLPRRMTELRKRHKTAIDSQFDVSQNPIEGKKFTVVSQGREVNIYSVEFINEEHNCQCSIRCEECKICSETISCDCYDYAIKNNLCKHTHYIALKFGTEEPNDGNNEDDSNLQISMTNELQEIKNLFLSQNSIKEKQYVETPT